MSPYSLKRKLRSLLAEGHEQPPLDYKKTLNLDERRDIVELAKDVAAMQSQKTGGYIVVGADDHGKVMSDLTPQLWKFFDEAKVRDKLTKYLAEPLDVRIAQHIINRQHLILIYIGPHEHGWAVFKSDGTYMKGKKEEVVFRPGDVFVRHGTASERWEPADQPQLIAQITPEGGVRRGDPRATGQRRGSDDERPAPSGAAGISPYLADGRDRLRPARPGAYPPRR